jgi:glycosyltransferase involved in cell wall biosynthesis
MKNPLVSVIMPNYNCERYLSESIESILKQSFKNLEFIIVDDGSTDNSLKIIQKYAKLDKRIKVLVNKKNLGLIKTLNRALKFVKGKYVARMDADDVSLPLRIEKEYKFLHSNPDIFLIGTGVITMYENRVLGKKVIFESFPERVKKMAISNNPVAHGTWMFRNNKKIYYREKMLYCEDYDLILRLISEGYKISNLKEPLYLYRMRPTSICKSKAGLSALFSEKAKEFYVQRLESKIDKYNLFEVKEILSKDYSKETSKIFLEAEIRSNFWIGDIKKNKLFLKKYLKNHGIFNQFLLFYLFSLLPRKIFLKLRKYKRIIIS